MGFERELAGWGGRLNRAAAAVSAGRAKSACARAGIAMTTGLIAGLCFTSAALARDGGAEHELAAYSRHHPAVHRAYPGGPGASPDQRAAFVAWVCGHIERQARGWKLPRAYFARLIWKESRFDPNAISHKGAEGIAQFMPATARLRGLEDPFDPESRNHRLCQVLGGAAR